MAKLILVVFRLVLILGADLYFSSFSAWRLYNIVFLECPTLSFHIAFGPIFTGSRGIVLALFETAILRVSRRLRDLVCKGNA